MNTVFYMLCGIILLLLLPSFLSPGLIKKQKQTDAKGFINNLDRQKLKQRRCKEHKLKDSEIMLMFIAILNVGVLTSLCAMVNELLLRSSHFMQIAQGEEQPPSYTEATRPHPGTLHHSLPTTASGEA